VHRSCAVVSASDSHQQLPPMDITRDVFLSDARTPYFTFTLTSRDLQAHSILSSLTPDEHEQVADALTAAASAVVDVLGTAQSREGGSGETTSFGCGT
jgi:hypothetical protein